MKTLSKKMLVSNSTITQLDVLFGRGTHCFNHVGSIALKIAVVSRLDSYVESKSKHLKTRLTQELIRFVQLGGGRFLTKIEQGNTTDGIIRTSDDVYWREIGDTEARTKIRDTLRDCIKSVHKTGYPSILLARINLAGRFDRNLLFNQIVEQIVDSSDMLVGGRSGINESSKQGLSAQAIIWHQGRVLSSNDVIGGDLVFDACPSTNVKEERETSYIPDSQVPQRLTFSCLASVFTSNRATAVDCSAGHVPKKAATNSISMRYPTSSRTKATSRNISICQLQQERGAQMQLREAAQPLQSRGIRRKSSLDERHQTAEVTASRQSLVSLSDSIEALLSADSLYLSLARYSQNSSPVATCQGNFPYQLIAPIVNDDGRYVDDDEYQPILPPFMYSSLEVHLSKIDNGNCATSKMIDRAIALSRVSNDALLDCFFSRTAALVSGNRNLHDVEPDQCHL